MAIAKLLWDVPLSGAVAGVVLPFLKEVGDRWEDGTLSVAHEHFVSDMLRRKLSALSATRSTAFTAHATTLRRVARDHALYVAGRGADEQTVAEIGATALPDDPVRAVVFLVAELSEINGDW